MKEFSCKTKIIFGSGAIGALAQLGAKRLMLVSDPFFVKSGVARKVAEAAKAEAYEIFDGVKPDPTVTLAAEGTARVKAFSPDLIAALGGGSAMDCAKAMAYFSGCDRLVAIPTTSGSGSEVTDFAILTHNGVKHPLVDSRLRPMAAILDDDLLAEMPSALVADGGFDVLTHALEAFAAKNATPITDALALDAFCQVFDLLQSSFDGDVSVRPRIHIAATAAGLAFTHAGLGICHSLAHSLGGIFHVPHGRLNAILLPAVIRANEAAAGEKYAQIARAAGLGGSAKSLAVRGLLGGLSRLRAGLHLPATLAQAGIPPQDVAVHADAIIKAALADPCCDTNPADPSADMLRRILQEVTGRG